MTSPFSSRLASTRKSPFSDKPPAQVPAILAFGLLMGRMFFASMKELATVTPRPSYMTPIVICCASLEASQETRFVWDWTGREMLNTLSRYTFIDTS